MGEVGEVGEVGEGEGRKAGRIQGLEEEEVVVEEGSEEGRRQGHLLEMRRAQGEEPLDWEALVSKVLAEAAQGRVLGEEAQEDKVPVEIAQGAKVAVRPKTQLLPRNLLRLFWLQHSKRMIE